MRRVTPNQLIEQKKEIRRLKKELEKVKKEKQQLENSTKKTNSEETLHESEQRFKMAVAAANIGTYSRDLKKQEDYWSPEFLAIYGLKPGEPFPLKEDIPAAVHPDDREVLIADARARFEHTISPGFSNEHRIIRPDGEVRWIIVKGQMNFDEDNKPLHIYGVVMDITQQKQAEEALRRKVEENEKMMEIIPAAIFISEDPQCNNMRGNRMANEFYEAEKDENVSANVTTARRFFIDGHETPAEELPMQKAAITNRPVFNEAVDVLLPSGKLLHMHGSAIPLNDENNNVRGSIAAFVDITKHVQTEKALKESEEKFRLMANNISQLAWMADEKGWIYWYNQRWFDYTGTTLEGMQGGGWEKVLHPDHMERVVNKVQHSWNTGEIWEDLFPLKGKDGQYRWFLSRALPVRDENKNNNVVRWFGTNTDITQQKELEELLKKNSELFENLLYITAHDLKGPIANMYMAFNFFKSAPDEQKIAMIGQFRELVDRLDKTIKGVTGILKVQKDDEAVAKELHFESILNDILIEFKDKIKTGTLEFDFSSQATIRYIGPYIYSLLKNLVSNAIKYSRDNAPLKITISTRSVNSYTLLTVQDNGMGIDMEKYGKQLFSPFRRFSPERAKGTGIGLYIVKNIIEKNGGYIKVKSTPGEGTAFYCYLKEYKV